MAFGIVDENTEDRHTVFWVSRLPYVVAPIVTSGPMGCVSWLSIT
jgi:hypothetical protein